MFVRFKKWDCVARGERYATPEARKAITLIDAQNGEPIATATTNVVQYSCPEDEIFVKNYSENEGMENALIKANIIHEDPTVVVQLGHVNIGRYQLTDMAMKQLFGSDPINSNPKNEKPL